MSDLYTDQVNLKRVLAGLATPSFTPAPEPVLKILDPEFFPGMGALCEDDRGRIRCPIRGCGEWHFNLGHHISGKHKSLGVPAIRRAVDIPKSVPLMSAKGRELRAMRAGSENTTGRFKKGQPQSVTMRALVREGRAASIAARNGSNRSMMSRNEADSCPSQTRDKITALARKLGRSPSAGDFRAEYGVAAFCAVEAVFGTWNNAKAIIGLATIPVGGVRGRNLLPLNFVIESLRTWVAVHGDLPTASQAQKPSLTPKLPHYGTILRAFGVNNWKAAMHSAIEHLQIRSERYGVPVSTYIERDGPRPAKWVAK
jgi:hypothetical protein